MGSGSTTSPPAQFGAQLGVQIRERFVEQIDAGIAHQGAPDGDALTLPARELRRLATEIVFQVQQTRGEIDAALDLILGHAGDAQTERQVAFDVHRRIERVGLEDHADRAVLGVSPRYVLVADRDTAVADVDQAGDAVQQGRLAAAGGAEQDQKLAVMDIEIEFLDDVRPAVTDAKIGNRYPCHRFF